MISVESSRHHYIKHITISPVMFMCGDFLISKCANYLARNLFRITPIEIMLVMASGNTALRLPVTVRQALRPSACSIS